MKAASDARVADLSVGAAQRAKEKVARRRGYWLKSSLSLGASVTLP